MRPLLHTCILALCIVYILFGTPACATEKTDEALSLAREGLFPKAEQILLAHERKTPDDPSIQEALAKVFLWNNRYDLAAARLEPLVARFPDNPDYRFLRGNLHAYQKHYTAARIDYEWVLQHYPAYTDAQDALNRLTRAREHTTSLWRLDVGYGISLYKGGDQPNWHRESAQIARQFEKGNVYLRGEQFEQFDDRDVFAEIGGVYTLRPYLIAEGAIGGSPSADFKPVFRAQSGVRTRIITEHEAVPIWLYYRYREDWYSASSSQTHNAGAAFSLTDNFDLSSHLILTNQSVHGYDTGWSTQIDGRVIDHLGLRAGYSVAADMDETSAETVRTFFGSLMLDLTENSTLRLDFSHEDRALTFDRDTIDVGLAYRF